MLESVVSLRQLQSHHRGCRDPAFDLVGQMLVVPLLEIVDREEPLDRGGAEYHLPLFKDSFED